MMPGPEEFRRDIRTVRCFTLAQSLLILLSMCGFVLAIAFAVSGSWREGAVTAGVCVASCGCTDLPFVQGKSACAGRRPSVTPSRFPMPSAMRRYAPR